MAYSVEDTSLYERYPIFWNTSIKLRDLEILMKRRILSRKNEAERKMNDFGFTLHSLDPEPDKEIIRKSLIREIDYHATTPLNHYHAHYLSIIASNTFYTQYADEENYYYELDI